MLPVEFTAIRLRDEVWVSQPPKPVLHGGVTNTEIKALCSVMSLEELGPHLPVIPRQLPHSIAYILRRNVSLRGKLTRDSGGDLGIRLLIASAAP